MIKYNKKIQKRFDININDYKEYSPFFSPIIIEIKPALEKYGKFINFNDDEELPFFHIYFNKSKEETKRNYLKKMKKSRK